MTGGRLIREARRRAGLTQQQLALRLGTQQPVIARWETGRQAPTFETVQRAIRACGLDLAVSLVAADHDHERLIDEALARSPGERLDHLVDLADLEELLHSARRAS